MAYRGTFQDRFPLAPAFEDFSRAAAQYSFYRSLPRDDKFRFFSGDGLQFMKRLDDDKQVSEMLVKFQADLQATREKWKRQDERTVRMWSDGTQSTPPEHEREEAVRNFKEGLLNVTSNVLGAFGQYLGQWKYPDDPEMQNRMGGFWANLGEMGLAAGETKNAAREVKEYYREYPPGVHRSTVYAPGRTGREAREGPDREPPPPNLEGAMTYSPHHEEEEHRSEHEIEFKQEGSSFWSSLKARLGHPEPVSATTIRDPRPTAPKWRPLRAPSAQPPVMKMPGSVGFGIGPLRPPTFGEPLTVTQHLSLTQHSLGESLPYRRWDYNMHLGTPSLSLVTPITKTPEWRPLLDRASTQPMGMKMPGSLGLGTPKLSPPSVGGPIAITQHLSLTQPKLGDSLTFRRPTYSLGIPALRAPTL